MSTTSFPNAVRFRQVHLTYFKPSGTYYTTGVYRTNRVELFDVWAEVGKMWEDGVLPGITSRPRPNFIIHIRTTGSTLTHLINTGFLPRDDS